MIAHIQGRLTEKTPTYVVIDCNGVGYHILISLNTFSLLSDGEQCKLLTHLAVREDAHLLYGFKEESERTLFRLLITVSGVGSSTALMILSALSPNETRQAILSNDINALKGVKGIGAKTAQRIVIDLKDKLAKDSLESDFSFGIDNTVKEEALSALVMLGFNKIQADKSIGKILKATPDLTVEELIKQVLKSI